MKIHTMFKIGLFINIFVLVFLILQSLALYMVIRGNQLDTTLVEWRK